MKKKKKSVFHIGTLKLSTHLSGVKRISLQNLSQLFKRVWCSMDNFCKYRTKERPELHWTNYCSCMLEFK